MKLLIRLSFLLIFSLSFGQAPEAYTAWIKKADSLYSAGNFKSSAHAYSSAFKSYGWKGTSSDRYNAACSWALCGNTDSSFYNLEKIVSGLNYSNLKHISQDSDLTSLHGDKRWNPLLEKVKANKEKSEINYIKPLIYLLDSLVTEDQEWRNYFVSYLNKTLGEDTISLETIKAKVGEIDSSNHIRIQHILKQYGYPTYEKAGAEGAHNFWLLVQHQDYFPEFQDSILKLMKIEVDRGQASATDYAYLVDRVKVNTDQLQVYGTQMQLNKEETSFEPQPVIEPEKLNERRAQVGLPSIEEYITIMNTRNFGSLKKQK